ncbi:MAG TPA: asparagine synthase (glutamine-hydrolyzing) [Nitrospira sp.]|nr:asparagine synthase (glutamine-hydrolyzing) [Nitrospira sp.]
MCGIAGQLNFDRTPVLPQRIAAMGASLRHRGPDDAGIYVHGEIGLAHQRLSILDLSPAGHQPMPNEDETVWVTFNGEIYNFEELHRQLRDRHTFRSRTDTEVIVHLYEEYGLGCVAMLRGMFAIAIWDARKHRLLLARDRVGKKPLYYTQGKDSLVFASELKALLVGEQPYDVDPVALHHYLTFQYVPAPWSIFTGIKKLSPGHILVCEQGTITEQTYWTLSYHEHPRPRSEQDYKEEFLSLLRESTRLRLASDVPLGAFLSGGLDSSTVVALMSELTTQPVKTFSVGFKEDAFNELPYAREVAAQFHTDHHELIVEDSAIDILPTLARVFDEPFADSSAIPTYYLSQLTRKFVTVTLNGDGGDELLAGYPRYHLSALDLALQECPISMRKRIAHMIHCLPATSGLLAALQNRLERLSQPFSHTYLGRICFFGPEEKDELYTTEFSRAVLNDNSLDLLTDWFDRVTATGLRNRLLGVDTMSYLPDDLLVKVDRATMAHGLEARSPFLDHHVLEFCAALPTDYKIRGGVSKYLLKTVMRDRLPPVVLQRSKMGFGVPIDQWFRGSCRTLVEDILLSSRCLQRGYFKPDLIRRLVEEQHQGRTSYGSRVYALLMLELWHREYVDRTDWNRLSEPEIRAVA